MSSRARWRGLIALLRDAVDGSSRAVERVQKEAAAGPFAVLEALPLGRVAAGVHVAHDLALSGAHGAIRFGNRAVCAAAGWTLSVVEWNDRRSGAAAAQDHRNEHQRKRETGGGGSAGGHGAAP